MKNQYPDDEYLKTKVETFEYYTSDSRLASDQSVFVALKGTTFDGHKFVNELLKQFPKLLAIVSQEFYDSQATKERLLPVSDSHLAHRSLAKIFRNRSKSIVIAIGGSSGKTSTKEFLKQLLQPYFNIVVTEKSQNGELGVPKTLESLRPQTQVTIVEVGIDRPGDMQRHMDIVQPDIGILTSIGEEHLEQLINLETVFKEESILFEAVWKREGVCFAPKADESLNRHALKPNMNFTQEKPNQIHESWESSLVNPLALRNAALASSVAKYLGLDVDQIKKGLLSLCLPEGRGRTWTTAKGQEIIADHYNSNPSSLRAGFAHLKSLDQNVSLYLVLGDMLELGVDTSKYHIELLEEALKLNPKGICLVGPQFAQAYQQLKPKLSHLEVVLLNRSDEANERLKEWKISQGRFFFKGSRGMALEKLLENFK